MNEPVNESVAIVGAGLAGLCCALRLRMLSIPYHIFESSDDVGGRVRTDLVDGFRCDRGFQVLLENYPECKRVLDYESLELRPFEPGAKIRIGNQFHTVADPRRKPQLAFKSMKAPVGSFTDKQKVATWGARISAKPLSHVFKGKDQTTLEYLKQQGFSDQIIERFFRPFLSGIYLESDLNTSAQMTEFIMKMMASGRVTLPRFGMGAISYQLADRVGRENISLNTKINKIDNGSLVMDSGEKITPKSIVLATEGDSAYRLLGLEEPEIKWTGTHCFYFSAPSKLFNSPWLTLNGSGDGPINNIAPVSAVSSEYSSSKKSIFSVSILEQDANELSETELQTEVLNQLSQWFGSQASSLEPIKYYRIKKALPYQEPGFIKKKTSHKIPKGIFLCGDYRTTSSIDGAMRSGRKTAEKLAKQLL